MTVSLRWSGLSVMSAPLRAPLMVLLAAAMAACSSACSTAASSGNAERRAAMPTPDLCHQVKRTAVAAALHGRVTGCKAGGTSTGYTVRFTGTSHGAPSSLTVAYAPRYAEDGTDRWATLGRPRGSRVSLIGVGDQAVFDPRAARTPQLMAVKGDVMVSINVRGGGLRISPDPLVAVAETALAQITVTSPRKT